MSGQTKSWPALCRVIKALREKGSWTGETHIQKTVFAYDRLSGDRLDLDFIIYKFGPFSFSLRDELSELRARGFVEFELQPDSMGPRYVVTPKGDALAALAHVDQTLLNGVVGVLADRNVKELEKVATALFVLTDQQNGQQDDSALKKQMKEYKPHLHENEISSAIVEARSLKSRLAPV